MWRSRRRLLLVATVLVLVLGAGAASVWRFTAHPPAQPVAHSPTVTPTISATIPTPAPTPTPPRPVRLMIPSLKIDAPIEAVSLDAQGYIANPVNSWAVTWYDGSVLPGQAGNSFLSGHLNWGDGPNGTGPVTPRVFWSLNTIKKEAEIRILEDNGTTLVFWVDSIGTVRWDTRQSEWFSREGPPTLTLTTCAGEWDRQAKTYTLRLIVHANLLG